MESGWKVAGCKVGQKAGGCGAGAAESGNGCRKSGGVRPRDSVPQNPLCTGFEAREFAGRE